ncbi:GntR family transcriptional regulator [Jannaschia ovalis]|uniref:GntR family transcriptional regulator n=1 Tax=Jannaschia ovalis TaxID=3038773 RepID=A0ABY8LB35_9RHOB|nr:GntR family transcriptional regulator [Jannaschia sp. GRR-S6-38]WGH78549.1 GntR family transcriptional regulator [Jannaschia sp. GRR-S6-38]
MEPLYRRILADLTDRIARGDLSPGQMLPSETEIGAQYGASQGTARKALSLLEARGILERRQGRGTFVAVSTDETALFHFFRLRDAAGALVTPVLERQSVTLRDATPDEVALDSPRVYEIDRLRRIDGRLAARERVVVAADRFPGLGERQTPANALYPFYQRAYGVAILTASETLAPAVAEAGQDGLEVAAGEALLLIRRQAGDVAGKVAELRRCTYAMAELTYAVDLR